MDSSSASTGDVIEIKGKDCRRTVAKCLLLYPSDEGKEIIRIDGLVRDNAGVPNHWMFNMGVVVAFMGALAYVVRVYARLVELGAETPAKNPYVAEMYKLALEGKLYSRSIP
jgi:hypothetical protein